jgi:protein tyrosine phosphatase (PTP) superfamily phosphohydrolase (DUF442 family)
MRIRLAISLTLLVAAGAAVGVWLTVETRRNRLVWDHFDIVKRDVLYRSGQLNSVQLAQAVKQYGIRTVVSFQFPGEGVEDERNLSRRLGVDFMNLPMPGDGFGQEVQFREVLKAVDDPARRPVLIHCARGTCRTGAAVALYRFERDGWTIGDVAAEMRRQVYREGWLPGYVFNMVRHRPGSERFSEPIVIDRNFPEFLPAVVEPSAGGYDSTEGLSYEPQEGPPPPAVAEGGTNRNEEPPHVR